MHLETRKWLWRVTLVCALLTPLCHVAVLTATQQDAMTLPIRYLSSGSLGWLQSVGLVGFGVGHWALALSLNELDRGRLWPWAQRLLFVSGAVLFFIAWFFTSRNVTQMTGVAASDPLWIIACTTGVAMGALQPGLSRLSPKLALFSGVCLGIWLWLVPLAFFVTDAWVGAYERLVGMVYVIWLTGVSLGLYDRCGRRSATAN